MSNLPERYAYAVTRLLPQSQRKEVADELRTTIEDMAADRAKKGNPTKADIEAVLQELGDPTILAHKYKTTQRYLIGPKWYDTYFELLKTLLSIVPPIVAAVMLAVNLAANEMPLVNAVIQAIGIGLTVAVNIAFWVTLVFAMLERFAKPKDMNDIKTWSPADLPQIPKYPERQIDTAEAASSAGFIAVGIIWLALTPVWSHKDGIPLFNPQIWELWGPLFFILAGLTLAHKLWQLKAGNWTTPLMVTNLLLSAASIVYILVLATTYQIVNLEYIRAWGVTTPAEELAGIVQWSTSLTAAAFAATYAWGSVQSVILNRRLTENK
jgi:hypothetical protein